MDTRQRPSRHLPGALAIRIIYPLGVILSTYQIGPGHQWKYRLRRASDETVVSVLTRPNLTLIIRVCLFFGLFQADVAQLVEQLICNQQVRGSIPLVSSVAPTHPECCEHKPRSSVRRGCVSDEGERRLGGVTEWLMVADCKSAGLTPYVGSNPTPTMVAGQTGSGAVGQGCRRRTWESARVGCSILPRCRSATLPRQEHAGVAQLVEHQPSKLRVAGSSPVARFPRSVRRSGGRWMHQAVTIWLRRTDRPTDCPPDDVARVAQLVERILGKDEVRGSIPRASLVKDGERRDS